MPKICAHSTTGLYDITATKYPGAAAFSTTGVAALSGLRAIMKTRIARKLADPTKGYVNWVAAPQAAELDGIPAAFSFVDQTGVAQTTVITSAAVVLSGMNAPAQISVTGGTYSINGGAFVSVQNFVNNGDSIRARHTSAGAPTTATNTVVTVGGVSDTFTSTTA